VFSFAFSVFLYYISVFCPLTNKIFPFFDFFSVYLLFLSSLRQWFLCEAKLSKALLNRVFNLHWVQSISEQVELYPSRLLASTTCTRRTSIRYLGLPVFFHFFLVTTSDGRKCPPLADIQITVDNTENLTEHDNLCTCHLPSKAAMF
jgi:hypothetical protein